jgi:CheY-like chemotaxis protein
MKAVHVLMVEDNPGDVDLTREALEAGRTGIELTVARDGVEAIEILKGGGGVRSSRPDLILLDLNLPRKGGRETLAEIKGDQELRHIPVIILTSSDAESDIRESYALGANCYVTKSMDLRAFRRIVGAVDFFWFGVAKLPERPGLIGNRGARGPAPISGDP